MDKWSAWPSSRRHWRAAAVNANWKTDVGRFPDFDVYTGCEHHDAGTSGVCGNQSETGRSAANSCIASCCASYRRRATANAAISKKACAKEEHGRAGFSTGAAATCATSTERR
jgi:hypothetical protein